MSGHGPVVLERDAHKELSLTNFNPWHMRIACLVLSASMLAACARTPDAASDTTRASKPAASVAATPAPGAASTSATAPDPARTEDTPVAVPPPPAVELPEESVNPSTDVADDLRCKSSADCAVKDVGSCCGYQPRCLNKDAQTFPERVKAQCAKDGRAGICGFQEIAGCECVAGQCAAAPAPGGTLVQ